MPRRKITTIRIEEPLLEAAKKKAAEKGEPLSVFIRMLLRKWVSESNGEDAPLPGIPPTPMKK